MIGSMFSGISGLSVHKQRMDVIGNDIANVNTVGFKQSDVTFKEGFINTLRSSLPRSPGMQHGMGVQTAQITRDFSGGALMETGRASNLAISGNGFFVVSSQSPQAQLLNAVQTLMPVGVGTGLDPTEDYDIDIVINDANPANPPVTYTINILDTDISAGDTPQDIIDLLNAKISETNLQGSGYGTGVTGGVQWAAWVGTNTPTFDLTLNGGAPITINANSAAVQAATNPANNNPFGPMADGETVSDMVNRLNADLVITHGVTDLEFFESPAGEIQLRIVPGQEANVQTFGVTDSVFSQALGLTTGNDIQALNIFEKVQFELNQGYVRLTPKVGDFDFQSLSISDGAANPGAMSALGFAAAGAETTAFGQDVTFYTRAGDFVLDVEGGDPNGELHLITSDGHRLQGVMGNPPAAMDQNTILEDIDLRRGLLPGQQVTAYAIGLDGTVMRSVDGAQMEMVGRIAIASPANPEGLDAVGANLYRPMDAAGITEFREAGSSGRGQIYQGYLENSNVDMAREFVDMIITQRGFQANSRTIGTSDEMLQELMNMKR